MATPKKSKLARRRPAPAGPEERVDAPSPAVVSGAPAPLRVVPPPIVPDPEVRERAARRRFTAEYKLQVLRQADQCAGVGELGALLRREGLYSSHLTTWRTARERGDLAGVPKKRGPVRRVADPRDKKLAEQERELSRWKKRAERAEALVELQKQMAALLGTPLATETS